MNRGDRRDPFAARADRPGGGWGEDIRVAAAFLTRLPLALDEVPPPGRLAGAARAFPVVGAAVGLVAGLAYGVAWGLGLPPFLAASAALAVQVTLTGALHEDALADLADGFGGGRDAKHALGIMRDSRLGTFGAVALFLSLAMRLGALATLAEPGAAVAALIAAGAVSRTGMGWVMARLAPVRRDGLGAAAGRPATADLYLATAIAGAVALLVPSLSVALAALAGAALGVVAVAALARRRIGGHTGDVLGTCQQAGEICFLLVAAAMA